MRWFHLSMVSVVDGFICQWFQLSIVSLIEGFICQWFHLSQSFFHCFILLSFKHLAGHNDSHKVLGNDHNGNTY
jgi:hypothetical protein